MRKKILILGAFSLMVIYVNTTFATESAMGRYSVGLFSSPTVAVVPPEGTYWGVSTQYYSGKVNKSANIPTGEALQSSVNTSFYSIALIGVWVPEQDLSALTRLSLGISVPLQFIETSGKLNKTQNTDQSGGIGDVMLAPTLGWKKDNHNISTSLKVFFPTGEYDKKSIANIGMNYWTISPTISYTYFNVESGVDFSSSIGVDINSRNKDTNYTSGAMSHIDVSLIQNFSSSFGAGVFVSALYQIQDDDGFMTDELNGFKGRAYSVGPIARYTTKFDDYSFNIVASWAPEVETKNRIKGNNYYLNVTGIF